MLLDASRVRTCLQSADLKSLFLDHLGWDHHDAFLEVPVESRCYQLRAVAHKRGMVAFTCQPDEEGRIPDYPIRRKIEGRVAKSVREHLIVYVDRDAATQIWQWVKREPGKPAACREQVYRVGQSGEPLLQRIHAIAFDLDEEDSLTLVDVTSRARSGFDVEKVTKRFYDRFKAEHAGFLGFVQGISSQGDREWYASAMLNRLMFVYFIQKKGFLDGDLHYLRNRLAAIQARAGMGHFLSFYRHFLLRLFHEGLGSQQRSVELDQLLGVIPYLNGGLFMPHPIEERYPSIEIADTAFERVFDFFDEYQWELDDRPLRADNEINPDVLGFIFEKYINQKQMGAYYTKEDITEYISKNTVIPFLLDAAAKKCRISFEGDESVWGVLQDDPDRYIYPAVRHGADRELPAEVAAGIDDVSKRDGWNRTAPAEWALPTETWREAVTRLTRYREVRAKLAAGYVRSVDDLVTYNLDIRQFAQDIIERCEGPELLRAFYHTIAGRVPERSNEEPLLGMSVLDPTCGSGAFLFAALNVLKPLYEACIQRMEGFVEDLERSGERHRPEKYADFRGVLHQVAAHPNRDYFILKSIMVNNLYGVDIMEEAVEICKLRLFLKLVSQVSRVKDVEPLPDIDFNIRAGNTLVGYASRDEVKQAILSTGSGQMKMLMGEEEDTLSRIEEAADIADRAFRRFHEMQTKQGVDDDDLRQAKIELRRRQDNLAEQLNQYLAREYGVQVGIGVPTLDYSLWLSSHQPFHWFVEFYGIMKKGGFDVIIGNPPYLERSRLGDVYRPTHMKTMMCRDIYAWVVERAYSLNGVSSRVGLIVPVSIASSQSFNVLRDVVLRPSWRTWVSHYANRPGQLFEGAQNRLTILLASNRYQEPAVFSSRYHRWNAKDGERSAMFSLVRYESIDSIGRSHHGMLPKAGLRCQIAVLAKILKKKALCLSTETTGQCPLYWVRVPGYFCQFFLSPPKAIPVNGGPPQNRGEVNKILLRGETDRGVVHSVLSSSTFYLFFSSFSDGRHINPSDVRDYPFVLAELSSELAASLAGLSRVLEAEMREHTSRVTKSGLYIESVDSRAVKSIIDEIDGKLAKYYGFTAEELDFIINYDIKYRMGIDGNSEE